MTDFLQWIFAVIVCMYAVSVTSERMCMCERMYINVTMCVRTFVCIRSSIGMHMCVRAY